MPFFRSTSPASPATTATLEPAVVKTQVKQAYQQGRVDERRRHHGSPVLTLVLILAALAGAVVLFYAFREGSFAGGGAVVDHKIAQASAEAVPAVQTAAVNAGAMAEKAGDSLKSQGQAIQQAAPSATPAKNP